VTGQDQVLDQIWQDKKPHLSHLQPFGNPCFPKYPNKDIKNHEPFETRATSAIFAGYDDRIRGYRCLDVENYQLIVCPDVTFDHTFEFPKVKVSRFAEKDILDAAALPTDDESYYPSDDSDSEFGQGNDYILFEDEPLFETAETMAARNNPNLPKDVDEPTLEDVQSQSLSMHTAQDNPTDSNQHLETFTIHKDSQIGNYTLEKIDTPAPKAFDNPTRNTKRISKPPKSYMPHMRESGEVPTAFFSLAQQFAANPIAFVSQFLPPPTKYADIAKRPDSAAWQEATNSEIEGLKTKGYIRKLVPRSSLPRDTLIYKSRYVFSRKSTGMAKTRWVIRGDMKKRHANKFPEQYSEEPSNYAPVAEKASFKVLCSIVISEYPFY
jgi:hypothetical protein